MRYMQAWEEKILEQQEARTEGLAEGRQEISKMIQFLIQNGREDEIQQAVSDPDFQEKLLKELKS